ncbi:hypothetical protein MG296_09995 [Flavobacteriaceae bacterium TK19130]|nr:hypothetical protein [Thermobacterium salinum]
MWQPSAKTKAIIAYLTFIGLIVAFFVNREDKHAFATWHIKNMFGLLLLLIVSLALQDYYIGFIIYWFAVGLWAFCFLMAILGKRQGIPFFSEKFQQWFTFLD